MFFGRDGQSEKLIAKLSVLHFLAVVGTSGSGKSLLVRAGARGYELLDTFLPDAKDPFYDQLRGFDWYYLWRLNHQEKMSLKGHTGFVFAVAFSSDGKTLASGSGDNTVKLWNVQNGQEITTLKGHTDPVTTVAFSSDGKTLASGSEDNTVKLWNVQSGQEITTLKGHTSFVYAVAFSADGKTLASGSRDSTVKLYFAATDEEVERQRNN